MELLLNIGGDPNAEDYDKWTPVHLVAGNESHSSPHLLKILLEKDENPNAKSNTKFTPVHLAASNKSRYSSAIMKRLRY